MATKVNYKNHCNCNCVYNYFFNNSIVECKKISNLNIPLKIQKITVRWQKQVSFSQKKKEGTKSQNKWRCLTNPRASLHLTLASTIISIIKYIYIYLLHPNILSLSQSQSQVPDHFIFILNILTLSLKLKKWSNKSQGAPKSSPTTSSSTANPPHSQLHHLSPPTLASTTLLLTSTSHSLSTPPTCAYTSTLTISLIVIGSLALSPRVGFSIPNNVGKKCFSLLTITSPWSSSERWPWSGFCICWKRVSFKVGLRKEIQMLSWGSSRFWRLLEFSITPSPLSLEFISFCGVYVVLFLYIYHDGVVVSGVSLLCFLVADMFWDMIKWD